MDPTTLAAAVTAFLVPFLCKVGTAIADQAQQQLPNQIGQIWDAILSKFKGKPAAQSSADDLKSKADDRDNQDAFALQLKKLLKDDPAFAAELEKLLQIAQATIEIANTGSGALATQGSVAAGAGGIAIGGDVKGSVVLGNHNTVVGGQPNREDGSSVHNAPDDENQSTRKEER